MALSPTRLRQVIAAGVFLVLGGSVLWVNRYPIPPRRVRPQMQVQGNVRTFGRSSIEGVVLGTDGKPTHADVSLVVESAPVPMRGGPIRGRRAAVARTSDDGRFSLGAISAGHYLVVARNVPGANEASDPASLWAAAEVDATDDAKTNVRLTLRRSGGVSGRLVLAPASGRAGADVAAAEAGLAGATLSVEPVDADSKASLLDGAPRVSPRGDGRFLIPDVPPGLYRLSAVVPSPWVLDQVTVDGRDGLDLPFRISPGGSVSDAALTAIDAPNLLTGEAVDATGRPSSFALVFAFPSDPDQRVAPRRRQATRSDARGRFTLTGLPSGTYLVSTAPTSEPDSWYSPAFFALLARTGSTVRLPAGGTAVALAGGVSK